MKRFGKYSIFTLAVCIPFFAHALDYTLLEPISGFLPRQVSVSFEDILVRYFRLTIAVAGLLAVIRITWCGFNLMMTVNPSAREDAKHCVQMAIFGLLLALSAFFIINTIIPQGGGFAIPLIPGTADEIGNAGLPGTPVCKLTSSKTTLYEG